MGKGIHGVGHIAWQEKQFKRTASEISKQERENKWRENRLFINNIGVRQLEHGYDYMEFEIANGQYMGTVLRLYTNQESFLHGEIRAVKYVNSRNKGKSQDGKINFEDTKYPKANDRLLVCGRMIKGIEKVMSTKPHKRKKAKRRVRVGAPKKGEY